MTLALPQALAGVPADVLATTFHVPASTFDAFEKGDNLITAKKATASSGKKSNINPTAG